MRSTVSTFDGKRHLNYGRDDVVESWWLSILVVADGGVDFGEKGVTGGSVARLCTEVHTISNRTR